MLDAALTPEELRRYARQIRLEHVGIEGQQRLKNARVLCVGVGGLGSPLSLYLAAAGVGTLGLLDGDTIAVSNLPRQVLYRAPDLGGKKVQVAARALKEVNTNLNVVTHDVMLNAENALGLIAHYDIIADCSDNFYTRYLINDTCFRLNKPYVFASVNQFQGHCALFLGKNSACFRCIFPESPDPNTVVDCNTGGVMGVLPGMLGMLQATEIIKWILLMGDLLAERLLMVDLLTAQFQTIRFAKNPECELCSLSQSPALPPQPLNLKTDYAVLPNELDTLLKNPATLLVDVRTHAEHAQQNLGGIVIPLDELPHRLTELDRKKTIILYCRSGRRSQLALQLLLTENFPSVKYLRQDEPLCS